MNRFVLFVGAVVMVSACGGEASSGEGSTSSSQPAQTTSTNQPGVVPTTPPTIGGEELPDESEIIAAAIADLAQRLGVDSETVEVIDAKAVQWPDSSLGCPQPGQMYTQAIVEGAHVLLGADGRLYDYRSGGDGNVVLCASDEKDGGREFVPPPSFDE